MRDADLKEGAPLLFKDNFATVTKEKLEAAAALKKTLTFESNRNGIIKGATLKVPSPGSGSHYNSQTNPTAANLP